MNTTGLYERARRELIVRGKRFFFLGGDQKPNPAMVIDLLSVGSWEREEYLTFLHYPQPLYAENHSPAGICSLFTGLANDVYYSVMTREQALKELKLDDLTRDWQSNWWREEAAVYIWKKEPDAEFGRVDSVQSIGLLRYLPRLEMWLGAESRKYSSGREPEVGIMLRSMQERLTGFINRQSDYWTNLGRTIGEMFRGQSEDPLPDIFS